jgi:hypothetical protein
LPLPNARATFEWPSGRNTRTARVHFYAEGVIQPSDGT